MRRVFLISLALVLVLPGWSTAYADDDADLLLDVIPAISAGLKPNYAPVPKTGQTVIYAAGDDGAWQKGVTWPTPRFTDNGNGTVTDKLTGLIWTKNANMLGTTKTWAIALATANNLKSGDYGLTDGSQPGDWRLPNSRELLSMVDDGRTQPAFPADHPFTNLMNTSRYWTSTTRADHTTDAWAADFNHGYLTTHLKATYFYVWCVRGGTKAKYAPVPRTGQTISYGTRDDGALQKGVTWPIPRFTDNNNGTVNDKLTGLIWTKNAYIFLDTQNWATALNLANNLKSGDPGSGLTDGSQAGDWRLPNRRELLSMVDYGRFNPAFPADHPFTNFVNTNIYWTSTTRADNTIDAWAVDFNYGYGGTFLKVQALHVWCVRGGS